MTKEIILVTGGAGYIGSHAAKALAAAGYQPIVYDSLINGHPWAVKWGPLEQGDILDRARLNEVITKYRPEAIMHFAALANVGDSVSDPAIYYRNNTIGTLTMLEAARDHNLQKVVFSSTCAVYGLPDQLPIREDAPLRPINPYGATKLASEQLLRDFGAAYGLSSVALRYFNAAGADSDGEIGEVHDPETHLIPLLLDTVSGKRPLMTVFGSDYDTDDGTCMRDYVHVADLADAHVLALRQLTAGSGEMAVYNLGQGRGFSVLEVIRSVERVTGRPVPVRYGARRTGDPLALVADPTKARIQLAWQPVRSELDDIVRSAWQWHRRFDDRAEPMALAAATA